MLANDGQDRPVTLAEALRNSAVRNAILDQVQLAAALNHSVMEKLGVHLIGMALSICAGAANAIAFAKFRMYVSHVSGSSTAVGLRLEAEQAGDVPTPAELVFYFIFGAVVAGLFIPSATLKMGQARYESVLFLVAAMELVCWWHELRYPEMLAAAMGLQNAMITSWSGAVLRTTHMTGTATDMGSALGRICSRFIRHGCSLSGYSEQDWDDHTVDRSKFVLMTCLLLSFIGGGFIGAAAYTALELHALLVPAGLTSTLGGLHLAYCVMKREEMAIEMAAEEMFARQLSGASSYQGGEDARDMEVGDLFMRQLSGASVKADRMEQFIRQISGASPKTQKKPMSEVPEHLTGS